MSPYSAIHSREDELGRPLTVEEHIEIIEHRMWQMRFRFYVIVTLLIASVLVGSTLGLYTYGRAQDQANKQACLQANARWGILRQNLINVALKRQPGETDKAYETRSARTLALLKGLFDVNCDDPSQRIPRPPPAPPRSS